MSAAFTASLSTAVWSPLSTAAPLLLPAIIFFSAPTNAK